MTQFEKIKSMSIEEMAVFLEDDDTLYQFCRSKYCPHHKADGTCTAYKNKMKAPCVEAAKQWLASEVSKS